MSDHVVKVIPRSPQQGVPEAVLASAVRYLNGTVAADRIEAHTYETPAFIDCGSNLEEIRCSLCGNELSFDWWGEAMDIAAQTGFASLEVTMPCCGGESSLNDLKYNFPCGFACAEIELLNPTSEIDPACIAQLEAIFGFPVRLIHAHI